MRSIVFSTVSHLDMYTGEDRKTRWRPLLELLRIESFKVDKLYFFISHLYRHIVPVLVQDLNNLSPQTEIIPVVTDLNGVLTYEDIAPAYKVFSGYFEKFRFDLINERYFFHLGPGNLFQHALMLIMLFHFKRLPLPDAASGPRSAKSRAASSWKSTKATSASGSPASRIRKSIMWRRRPSSNRPSKDAIPSSTR